LRQITLFVLGECPSCGEGPVTVAKRSDGRLFAICLECEAEWVDPLLAPNRAGMGPKGAAHDVWPPLWPTRDEIVKAGLLDRVYEIEDEIE